LYPSRNGNTVGTWEGDHASCTLYSTEPVFVDLLRIPGIDFQPGVIDSWAPQTLTNTEECGTNKRLEWSLWDKEVPRVKNVRQRSRMYDKEVACLNNVRQRSAWSEECETKKRLVWRMWDKEAPVIKNVRQRSAWSEEYEKVSACNLE
jgi:hypothetical protein